MKCITAALCVLCVACSLPVSEARYGELISTHPVHSTVRMTRTGAGGVDRELMIEEGRLSVRFEHSGVSLDLNEYPGEEVTRYFDSLEGPLEFELPDGTSFVYFGDAFEVDGATYELEPGSGISSFSRSGSLSNP